MSANATKNLLLVTAGFPYGESERSFLSTEFSHLCDQFNVSVLALCHNPQLLYPFEQNVPHEAYAFPPLRSAATLAMLPFLVQKIFRTELRGLSLSAATGATAYYLNALHALPLLRRRVMERNIHIIYTYWCSEITLAALLLRRELPHLKVVTRFHGVDLYNERRHDGRQPFRTAIADGADRLIFPCNRARDYFLQHWGAQYAAKSVTAYLGCRSFPRIAAEDKPTVVLVSCSNLIPLKRVDRIIDALALLPKELSVSWHHIGDGAVRTILEARAQRTLAAKDNVSWQFHGAVPNHALPELYERLAPQLFLTATSTEGGVPVSIQEAASASIPSVGTDVGGVGELILHRSTGFLLTPDASAPEIADAISAFCSLSLSQRTAMGEAAFHLWQTAFDAENNASAMCQLLDSL